ncbi:MULTISPECIES: sensor histidine kinase [unclassified Paraflavitalea]|uniref:sensor histidine kinase n=1 Tax=unclassified Paraflavitalea TaxID=2798305 RepID=UPI003D34F77D
MFSKRIIWVLHILGWLLLFSLIQLFIYGNSNAHFEWRHLLSVHYLIFFIIYCGLFYVNLELLFPRLLLSKLILVYLLCIGAFLSIILYTTPFDHLMQLGADPNNFPPIPPNQFKVPPPPNGPMPRGKPQLDIVSLILFICIWTASSAIAIFRRLQQTERRLLQAAAEKSAAELAFFKMQVNPHFLFNTLNNLYALASTKSEKAAPAILQLSNLMRYINDEMGKSTVPVEREIECIQNIIDLQKLRLNKLTTINFNIEGDFENIQIAPLIFVPFVENLFKHGVSNHESSNIIISLTRNGHDIRFHTSNRRFNLRSSSERTGTGISNIQKRLELLYPGKHQLSITNTPNSFTVDLTIEATVAT